MSRCEGNIVTKMAAKGDTAARRRAKKASSKARAAAPVVDADVRAAILDAAVRAIEEEGLAAVSMRDVARRAGVSHQLPYHYFVDREGIFATIAETGFAMLGERLREVTARGSAANRLAAAGRAYVAFAIEHPAHFRMMFRPDFVRIDRHPTTKERAEDCFATLPDLVAAAIAEGLPPDPTLRGHVVMAWSVAHGLACLFVDGPLVRKMPDLENEKAAVTGEVMAAMKMLVERASGAKPSKR